MASAVTLQVFQDFVFHNLDLETMLTLPVKTLASQPQQQEGTLFYNLTDNLPYVSAGTSWLPVLTGTTDVASAISLTAPSITLTGDDTGVTISAPGSGTGNVSITADNRITVQPVNNDLILGSQNASILIDPATFVIQATNINTAVTADSNVAKIRTQTATTAAEGTDSFTVNCDRCRSSSFVFVTVDSYTGTGLPFVSATSVANGSFTIVISNASSGAALNATLDIVFLVIGLLN